MGHTGIDICCTLLKYSYADSARISSAIEWTHYSAKDLCVLVRGSTSSSSEISLSIVEKMTEHVDIARYVAMAIEARAQARLSRLSLNVEQLPIFGITKEALLALRYRTANGRVRRIQLRFANVMQCQQVVDVLVRRGVDFQEQRPATGRPNIVSTTPASRPSTAQGEYTRAVHRAAPGPFQLPSVGPGSLGSNTQTSSSSPGKSAVSTGPRPSTAFADTPLIASGHGLGMRPFAESKLISLSAPVNAAQRNLAPSQQADAQSQANGQLDDRLAAARFTAPEANSSSDTVLPDASLRAPMTRSSSSDIHIQGESQYRFSIPDERTRDATRSSSRPSSALDLPPLQMPRLVKARPGSALNNSSPASNSQVDTQPPSYVSGPARSREVASQDPIVHTTSKPQSFFIPNNLVGQHAAGRPSSDVPNMGFGRLSSLVDAPHEIETPPGTAGAATPVEQPFKHQNDGSPGQTAPGPPLKRYEAQQPQVREAALNQFMMNHLNDPAFATLCADVENCWRRIALGL